jgi:hypothetical protein
LEFREQKKREQEEKLQVARALLDKGKFDEASSAMREALYTRLFAETDPRVAKLLEEIYTKKKSASSGDSSSGGMGVLGDIFPAGTKSDPGKGDPARDYVYVREVEPSRLPACTSQNISAAAAGTFAPGGEGQTSQATNSESSPVLPSSPASGTGIPAAPSSGAGQRSSIGLPTSWFDPGWQDRERQFLSNVEKQLAAYVGPIASIVAGRTAAKASNPAELIALLASTLHVEADRKAFLARKNELLRSLTRPVPPSTSSLSDSQTLAHAASQLQATIPAVPLTPAAIRHAGDLLARYLGPVSRILAERSAPRATSEQGLYALLAEHLQDPAERARFLRDAGFPQS